jgi:hypothetical protein
MQEEQHLAFVVLPNLKIVGAMYDSTYPTAKTREEQQQMWAKLLFYHSRKIMKLNRFSSLLLLPSQHPKNITSIAIINFGAKQHAGIQKEKSEKTELVITPTMCA